MSHLNKKIMKQFYSLICLPIVLAGAFFLNACADNGTPGTEDVPVEKIELGRASENASWPVVAVSGLPAYRDKVPAPENTSGWYLPSMKEYSLLCTGEQDIKENIWDISGGENYIQNGLFINERLSMVEGSKLLEMEQSFDSVAGTYWSSQEHTESMALKLFFRFGTVSTSDKDWQYQTNGRVRYILAF